MKQQWRKCPGYEDTHRVSSLGNVRSVDRDVKSCYGSIVRRKGKAIKPDTSGKYLRVQLKKGGRKELIHRLVALAFIPNPLNKTQVNHKNGLRSDNQRSNLEWATCAENISHSFDVGMSRNKRGASNPLSLPVYLYRDGVELRFNSTRQAADFLGTSMKNLGHTISGRKALCMGYAASRLPFTIISPEP